MDLVSSREKMTARFGVSLSTDLESVHVGFDNLGLFY